MSSTTGRPREINQDGNPTQRTVSSPLAREGGLIGDCTAFESAGLCHNREEIHDAQPATLATSRAEGSHGTLGYVHRASGHVDTTIVRAVHV